MCISAHPFKSSAPACTDMEGQSGFGGLYETDEFRLYCFKILPCSKRVPHNWQQCVFAHWGEKARRRDLRTHTYSSQLCPDAKREGGCPRGDACPMSHNIFEAWLHPELYRTQMCTSGSSCNRTVCFFAHSPAELRQPSKPCQQQQMPIADAAASAPKQQQQQQAQGALLRSNVAAAAAAAAAAAGRNTTYVPSMQPWSSSSSTITASRPLLSQSSTVQHQVMLSCLDNIDLLPSSSDGCRLACDSSLDAYSMTGAGSSSSGWSSSSSSIACSSPTACNLTNLTNTSCMLLGDALPPSAASAAAAAVLPVPTVYRSTSSGSSSSSLASGNAELALALQQLKLVPEGPAVVVSSPAAPSATTAGMTFEFQNNNSNKNNFNGPSLGLAGDLQMLQPGSAAVNALLLQQQREQLQQQQLLLAQQEQMLLQQQLQLMNMGLGSQQMMLFSH